MPTGLTVPNAKHWLLVALRLSKPRKICYLVCLQFIITRFYVLELNYNSHTIVQLGRSREFLGLYRLDLQIKVILVVVTVATVWIKFQTWNSKLVTTWPLEDKKTTPRSVFHCLEHNPINETTREMLNESNKGNKGNKGTEWSKHSE